MPVSNDMWSDLLVGARTEKARRERMVLVYIIAANVNVEVERNKNLKKGKE